MKKLSYQIDDINWAYPILDGCWQASQFSQTNYEQQRLQFHCIKAPNSRFFSLLIVMFLINFIGAFKSKALAYA